MTSETESDKRAPEGLQAVQDFVNSADFDRGEDALTTPAALQDWLASRQLVDPGTPVTEADLRRAIEMREGLRSVLATHNGIEADSAALERLERASRRAALHATFAEGAPPGLAPAVKGTDAGLARLLAAVATAQADGTWSRLKACADEDCLWAFYDHSKNRRGRWCSMAVCGNQHKARAYRERAKAFDS